MEEYVHIYVYITVETKSTIYSVWFSKVIVLLSVSL